MVKLGNKKSIITILLFIFSMTLFTFKIFSQNVELKVDSNIFYLRQPFSASIIVANGKPDEVPNLSILSSRFDVLYLGQSRSTQTSIINGKRDTIKSIVFNYRLTPLVEGEINIPPIRVPVNGNSFLTQSLKINIERPGEVDGFNFRISRKKNRKTAYIGEPITLELILHSPVPIGNLSFEGMITKPNELFSFDGYIVNNLQNQGTILFEGLELPAGYEWSIINGKRLFVLTVSLQITPKKIGTITLSPENISFLAAMEKDIFGEDILSSAMLLESNELTIQINELPTEINLSPNGIIFTEGELFCKAKSSTSRLLEGDPLTYTIDFSGITNFNTVHIPEFSNNEAILNKFKNQFSIKSNGSLRNINPTKNQNRQENLYQVSEILIPVNKDIIEIPALSFTYFNLQTEKVESVKTNPIPLEILPSNSSTLNLNDDIYNPEENFTASINEKPDFISNFSINEILKEGNRYEKNLIPLFIPFFAIPPIIFLILYIFKNINSNSNSHKSLKSQRKKITELKDLINKNPEEIDSNNLENIIRKHFCDNPSSRDFLQLTETLRYKGTPANNSEITELISLAKKIILESTLNRKNEKNKRGIK